MSLENAVDPTFDKAHAAWVVAQRFGATSETFNPWAFDVEREFGQLATPDRRAMNTWIEKVSFDQAKQVREIDFVGQTWRSFPAVNHFSGAPKCFLTGGDRVAHPIGKWSYYEVRGGYVMMLPNAPVIFDADGNLIASFGSAYKDLVYFYNVDMREKFSEAPYIGGESILISDDISMTRSFNYAHWMTDWIPRLAFAGNAIHLRELNIVMTPFRAPAQTRAFDLMSVPQENRLQLKELDCFRFEKIFVPDDLTFGKIRHPAQTASSIAIGFLRSALGYNALSTISRSHAAKPSNKIYISREDAPGRKVVNEAEFFPALERHGYKKVSLSGLSLEEQVYLFANASHIIGIHGAGLANLVYCECNTKVLELFPDDFGLVSIRALAQSVGCEYATYVSPSVRRENRELDDLMIDVPGFMSACGDWI